MNQALKDSHVDNNYKDMPNICQRYARSNSEATNLRRLRYAKYMLNICQRHATYSIQLRKAKVCQIYTKYIPGVIQRLQIQDNYRKQRYAKDMPSYAKDNYLKLWAP